MQGKMDIIMMISEKTRTDKEKIRGKIWLKILRMTKTLTKNRENHHQKQDKFVIDDIKFEIEESPIKKVKQEFNEDEVYNPMI